MFKLFVTLMRGKNADAAESLADATALPVLRHRVIPNYNATGEGLGADALITRLLELVPA